MNEARRVRWGTLLVASCFLLSLAGGIGFVVAYWSFEKTPWDAGNTGVLGGSLAVFFLGLGSGLVLHAHWLMEHRQVVEPREELAPAPEEREAALATLAAGPEVQRRGLLVGMGFAAAGVVAAMFASLVRSLATERPEPTQKPVWRRGQRLVGHDGSPMSLDSLEVGGTAVVFPEDQVGHERAQTVLLRVDERQLRLPPRRQGWAPRGYLAYSRVCTHAGCPVGMYETTTCLLMCPCHQSTFDVLRAARPTSGPAARPLPQLPLYADAGGQLRAAGSFSELPGPGYWDMFA